MLFITKVAILTHSPFALSNLVSDLTIHSQNFCFHLWLEEPKRKLIDFSKSSQISKVTPLEKLHLEAGLFIAEEDYERAMASYENILAKFPRDAYALQMGYFLALTTGHTSKLR